MISQVEMIKNWNSMVASAKKKFGNFTADELAKVEGNFEQLVGLVQRKTGQSRENISSFLTECCKSAESSYGRVANIASEYASTAGEVLHDQYDRVASEAKKGLDYTAKSVGRKPLESLALAVGSGIVAGVLIGLSMANRKRQ